MYVYVIKIFCKWFFDKYHNTKIQCRDVEHIIRNDWKQTNFIRERMLCWYLNNNIS